MSNVKSVYKNYGIFYKDFCPGLAFLPYRVAFDMFGGNESGGDVGFGAIPGCCAVIGCILLSPVLIPLTLALSAITFGIAALATVLSPLVYAGAAIADCAFSSDDAEGVAFVR